PARHRSGPRTWRRGAGALQHQPCLQLVARGWRVGGGFLASAGRGQGANPRAPGEHYQDARERRTTAAQELDALSLCDLAKPVAPRRASATRARGTARTTPARCAGASADPGATRRSPADSGDTSDLAYGPG